MAYHCYHDTPCPTCGRYYVRYREDIACPFCGSTTAPVYDIVDEIVYYAKRTFIAQGDISLGPFRAASEADRYVIYAYETLEAFRQHPGLEPALVAAEAADQFRLGNENDPLREHWVGFLTAVLERWREERHRPLPREW